MRRARRGLKEHSLRRPRDVGLRTEGVHVAPSGPAPLRHRRLGLFHLLELFGGAGARALPRRGARDGGEERGRRRCGRRVRRICGPRPAEGREPLAPVADSAPRHKTTECARVLGFPRLAPHRLQRRQPLSGWPYVPRRVEVVLGTGGAAGRGASRGRRRLGRRRVPPLHVVRALAQACRNTELPNDEVEQRCQGPEARRSGGTKDGHRIPRMLLGNGVGGMQGLASEMPRVP
mmetsp:Transcript_109402/g.316247  ORF Transcript_109402/g.316247 Transcript_109402/m.316247 type:complete len:233 (-) Transcript_109402:259-957(-)